MAENELDLSAVISKLMSDKNVVDLIENIKANAENGESVTKNTEDLHGDLSTSETSAGVQNTGNMPAGLMEKLPEVMSAIGPLMKNGTLKNSKAGAEVEKRNRLLLALKPYLNGSRCDMIDSIVTLSKLTSLVDLLPGSGK